MFFLTPVIRLNLVDGNFLACQYFILINKKIKLLHYHKNFCTSFNQVFS